MADPIETEHDELAAAEYEQMAEQPEPEAVPATVRLREFEDDRYGKDVVRIDGKIEKGHGSRHALAPADVKAHHTALEGAIDAEKNLGEARVKLIEAEKAVVTAEARVSATVPQEA